MSTPPPSPAAPPGAETLPLEQESWLRLDGSLHEATHADGTERPRRPPPTVPGYRVLDELGRGGMGVVYLAIEEKLRRRVALKVIGEGATADPENFARFRAEAAAIARLRHPNIVQIYEVGEAEGLPYFALEHLEGGSLRQRCAGKPQDPRESAEIVRQLADAVDYAHQQGIIHRDLKPANVLLGEPPASAGGLRSGGPDRSADAPRSPGIPKIADFGLAKFDPERQATLGSGATKTGEVLGTPNYMAPEQAEGKPEKIGPAVDLYALGAILYELLTGRPPFDGPNPMDILIRLVTEEPLAPRRLQPKLPRDLETICLKCLNKEPARRYPSGRALGEDLRRWLAGEPIEARPAPFWERGWKWAKRRPALATFGAVALAASLLLLVGGWWTSALLNEALERARTAEAAAQRNAVRAGKLAVQAESQRQIALQAFRDFVYDVRSKLADDPKTRPLQQLLLQKAIVGLAELAKGAAAAEPDANRVDAHILLATIYQRLGDRDLALAQYREARRVNDALLADDPTAPRALDRACDVDLFFINRLLDRDQTDEAMAVLQAFLPRLDAGRAARPEDFEILRSCYRTQEKLGHLLHWRHRPKEALAAFEASHRHAQEMLKQRPDDRHAQYAVQVASAWLGRVWRELGEPKKADGFTQAAYALSRSLLERDPLNPNYRVSLLNSQDELALVAEAEGRPSEARTLMRELPALLERAAAHDPDDVDIRLNLIDAWLNLGQFEQTHFDPAAARACYLKSQELLDQLKAKGKLAGKRIYEVQRPEEIGRCLALLGAVDSLARDRAAHLAPKFQDERGEALAVLLRLQLHRGQAAEAEQTFQALAALPEGNAIALLHKAQAFAIALNVPPGEPCYQESATGRRLEQELTKGALAALRAACAQQQFSQAVFATNYFDTLRKNPEFQALKQAAEAKGKAAPAK